MLAGWVLTNPVGGSPDELNHVLRAEAVGRGDLDGRPNPELAQPDGPAETVKACCSPDNPARLRWVQRGARMVDVPAGLDFGTCFDAAPGFVADCVEREPPPTVPERLTTMGTLEPVPYILPGLATRLADDPIAAVRWARAANALITLVLLGLAAAALRSPAGGPLAWMGLVVAVSPMVLFVGASPAPSAAEVAGGVCFAAGLVRLARSPEQAPGPAAWAALAIGGAALAASRSLGPVWVVLDVVAVAALAGPRRLWSTVRGAGGWAVVAIGAVVTAGLATVGWEATRQPGIPFDVGFFFNQLGPSTADLPRVQREVVGVFGAIDLPLPAAARWVWMALVVGVLVAAAVVGNRRQRVALASTVVATVVVTVLVSSALLRQNGFQVQGRHVLAFAVLVPLLAGDVVFANRHRLPGWWRPGVVVGIVATSAVTIHVVGLHTSLRHFATTPDHVGWVLQGPWWPWALAVALVGGAAVAGASGRPGGRPPRRTAPPGGA